MAQANMDFIVNTKLNKAAFTDLKKEISSLRNLTEKDLINVGSAKNFQEAKTQLESIKSSAASVEAALNKAFSPKLGTVSLSKFNNELKKMNLQQLANDFSKAGAIGTTAFRSLTAEALTTKTQIKETHKILDDMGKTLSNTIKWGISSSAWNTITGSFQKAYNYVKDLDKSLNNIRIVSGHSADQMERFARQANKAAKELGATTLDYTNASLIYYQQGLNEKQVQERANTTIKLANVLGVSAEEVSDYMTAIWNNFDDGSKSIEYYADVLAKLGAATASSAEEISTGLEKFAAIADTVGLSYEYATAALTTVTATTRQSAEVVGTAFKTLFARIQDLELGKTLDDGVTLGKYSEALNAIGINILDANGNLREMDDILDDMGQKWDSLSEAQQVSVAQTVAGVRQYNQLIALMDNWESFTVNLNTAKNATGELNKQQEIYMESTEAHLNKLSASAERLYKSLIDSEGLNDLIDIFTGLVTGVANYTEAIGGSKAVLAQLGALGLKVFGRSLSQGIATTISNIQKVRDTAKDFNAQLDLMQKFKGIKVDDRAYQNLLQMVEAINDYKDILSEVQIQEANALVMEYNEAENKATQWQAAKKYAEEYYSLITNGQVANLSQSFSNEDLENYFKTLDEGIVQYEQKLGKARTEINSELSNQSHSSSIIDEYIQSARDILNRDLVKNEKIVNTLKAALERYDKAGLKNDIDQFSDEQIDALSGFGEAYGNAADEILKDTKKIKDTFKEAMLGMEESSEFAVEEIQGKWKDFGSKITVQDISQNFSNLTGQILMIGSAIDSVKRLPDIWADQELSTGEKILQTAIAIGTAFNGVAQAYQATHSIAEILRGTVYKNAAAWELQREIQKSANEQTEQNIQSQAIYQDTLNDAKPEFDLTQEELVESSQRTVQNSSLVDDNTRAIRQQTVALIEQNKVRAQSSQRKTALTNKLFEEVEEDITKGGEDAIDTAKKLMDQILPEDQLESETERIFNKLKKKITSENEKLKEGQMSPLFDMEALSISDDELKEIARQKAAESLTRKRQKVQEKSSTNKIPLQLSLDDFNEAGEILPDVNEKVEETKTNIEKTSEALQNMKNGGTKGKTPTPGKGGLFSGLKADFSTILGAIKMIPPQAYIAVAAVAAVGAAIYLVYRQATKEERELKEALKRAEENVTKVTEAYKSLNETVSNYKNAREGIKELEQGTVEFYQAIMEANDKALELIDTLGLIAGKDYSVNADGLIQIDEEALKQGLKDQQRLVFQAQGDLYTARYNMTEYKREQDVKDFTKTVNRKYGIKSGFLTYDVAEKILADKLAETKVGTTEDGADIYRSQVDLQNFNERYNQGIQKGNTFEANAVAAWGEIAPPQLVIAKDLMMTAATVAQAQNAEMSDISKEVGFFRAEYNEKTAEMLALQQSMADSYIRAYADDATLAIYEDATDMQRKQMQTYTAKQIEKESRKVEGTTKSGYGSFWDTSDLGFWGTLGVETLNSLTLGWLGESNKIANRNKVSDMELKEMYAKNVLGYTKEDNGKWYNQDGELVKEKEIRKLDLDKAKDAYLSGQYVAEENAKTAATLLSNSKDTSAKQGFDSVSQDYIAEAYLAYVNGDSSFDFSVLNDKEREEVKNQMLKYTEEAPSGVYDWTNQISTWNKFATDIYDEEKRTAEDIDRFNQTIEQQAAAVGASTSALKLYAIAEQNATDANKKLTAEVARSAAESYKFNKAYNQGRKTFTDNKDAFNKYVKALKNGEKISYDIADGAGAIVESLAEMGIQLSTDQLKDPEALENIKTLFTGTEKEAEKAYKKLQEMAWVDTLVSKFGMAKTAAQDFVDALKDTKVNQYIDMDGLEESFGSTQRSLEEWKEWAEDYGIDIEVKPDVETTTNEIDYQAPPTVTRHEITDSTGPNGNYSYTETIYPGKTKLFGIGDLKLKKTSTGGGNFKPSSTGNANGGNKNKKKVEKDKDLYEKVNVELARTGKMLDRLDKQASHLVGQDYINNAIKQIQTLNKEIDLTKEKISIMEKERDRLRKTLTKTFGAKFDEDGVLQNYDAIYEKEFAKYKKIQEGNYSDEKKEKSEERWQKFLETYQRYDEIVGTDLPELENDVLEKIYQIIEKQIDKFEYTIKINLDLSEAKREWAEFRKKYILGLEEDEDFAKIAQVDFGKLGSFFNDKGKGELQVLFNELSTINGEIEKMNNGELSSIFSADGVNDMNAAIEKQKEVLEKIMSSYGNFDEILDAINESYRNMLDAAETDFGEHIEDLENINNLLEHNKNVLNMIFGDQGYKQLSEVLKLQNANNKQTLDDLRAQRDYYKTEMAKEEEGSDNWNALVEKYASITAQIESQFETYMQGLIDTLINDVNASFQKVNEELLGEDISLNYAQTEWDMINRNADQYLDTVNAIYSTQKLQNKYLDAIDKTESVTQQKKLNDLMDKELKALREKDKLSQYDLDRANLKYEIALKQIALEEAQQNKSQLRLRRDSQGNYTYQYTADSEKVASAEQELSDLYNQLYNLDKDEYKNNLDQLYAAYAEFQQKMAEAKNIADEEEQKKYEEMIKAQYQALTDTLTAKNEEIQSNLQESTTSSLLDSYEQNTENYEMMTEAQKDILEQYIDTEAEMQGAAFDNLFGLYNKNLENFNNMTSAEINTLMTSFVPQWNSTYQQLATSIIGKGGFAEVYKNAFAEIDALTKQFFETRATEWEKWKKDQEEAYSALTGIVESNDKIIQRYTEEAAAIREVVAELEVYLEKYGDAIEAVKQLITLTQQLREETDDTLTNVNQDGTDTGSEDTDGGNNDNNNNNNNTDTKPSLTKGSAVKLKAGTKWYGDSYGGGGSGSTSKQKSVTITRVNENGSHPYHVNKLGWVRKKDIVGYDTGGYTGNWANSDGRLAMLHKKELVLNAHDTQNMLDAVTILRDLTSNLGATLLGRMASISANGIGAFGDTGAAAGLEQMVTINAEFPNVTNSHEIEDAINNLVNRASQYIHKN